jgi:DNA-directed RNA polymerase specialized sigma subunit
VRPQGPLPCVPILPAVLDEAGRRIVEQHVNVADGTAWDYWRRARHVTDLDELQAVARLGLVQAAERFPEYQREHGYPLDDHRYLVAFLSRRVHGALFDYGRSRDWLTREQRRKAKALEQAAVPGGGTAELAEAAGMTLAEAEDALAAQAASPVHLGDEYGPDGVELAWGERLRDEAADVESAAAVGAVLSAAVRVIRGLPWPQQVVLARVYVRQEKLAHVVGDVARALGVTEHRVGELHKAALWAVHGAMLAAASEGCPCRRREACRCA